MQGERFSEDLHQLAGEAWEVAGRLCGTCRNLHVLWPYQRLAGSPGRDVAVVEPVLRRLLSASGRKVLIAGCADSGLLALVARTANPATAITVVDRCETPLELCRRFARRWDTEATECMRLPTKYPRKNAMATMSTRAVMARSLV